jgi:hypothetical protein
VPARQLTAENDFSKLFAAISKSVRVMVGWS